jgi:hypothetical protein
MRVQGNISPYTIYFGRPNTASYSAVLGKAYKVGKTEYGLRLAKRVLDQANKTKNTGKLPVVITQVVYYSKTDNLGYKLCSKVGQLQGTYGRDELEPCSQLTAEVMGINVKEHEEKKAITALESHALYLNIGGKTATAGAKVTAANQEVANANCHNKQENLLCQLCTMERE